MLYIILGTRSIDNMVSKLIIWHLW